MRTPAVGLPLDAPPSAMGKVIEMLGHQEQQELMLRYSDHNGFRSACSKLSVLSESLSGVPASRPIDDTLDKSEGLMQDTPVQ